MQTEKRESIEAVVKLIQLTQHGELKWEIDPPPQHFSKRPNTRVEVVFLAKYAEKRLRLYEKRFQEEFVDFEEYELRPVPLGEWRKVVVLEFIDEAGNSLWEFPAIEALNDLFSAVRYKVAGVKDFLTELLAS